MREAEWRNASPLQGFKGAEPLCGGSRGAEPHCRGSRGRSPFACYFLSERQKVTKERVPLVVKVGCSASSLTIRGGFVETYYAAWRQRRHSRFTPKRTSTDLSSVYAPLIVEGR